MEKKKGYRAFWVIRALVRLFYHKMEVEGQENLPAEPALIVGNHTQMNGPIACELYFPGAHYTWCAGEMMHFKEVPGYAFQDFWSQKPRWCRWFYKLLSYIIAPLSVCVFNNADTVPVYRDARIMTTFKTTLRRLQEGAHVIIFPEHDVPHNHIVCQFQDKFVDIARMHYKRTGQALQFVPMYIAPYLKKMVLGEPICFCPENPIEQERARICDYLMAQITELACSLPPHTVVPYQNRPKKTYGTNIPREVKESENTGC